MCNWSKVGTRELGEQSLTTKAGGQEDSPRDKSLSTMSGDGRRSLNGLGKAHFWGGGKVDTNLLTATLQPASPITRKADKLFVKLFKMLLTGYELLKCLVLTIGMATRPSKSQAFQETQGWPWLARPHGGGPRWSAQQFQHEERHG